MVSSGADIASDYHGEIARVSGLIDKLIRKRDCLLEDLPAEQKEKLCKGYTEYLKNSWHFGEDRWIR